MNPSLTRRVRAAIPAKAEFWTNGPTPRENHESMKSVAQCRWLVGMAAVAATTAWAARASAHGGGGADVDVDKSDASNKSSSSPAANGQASAGAETPVEPANEEGEANHEERVMVGLDLVLGWGKVPFAVQNLPSASNGAVTYTRNDAVHSNVQSFILGASAEVVEHLGVGLRLPFTFAGFSPDGSQGRQTTSFGNLELEGEYGDRIAQGLRLYGALGVALPTAQGDEIPPDLNNVSAQLVNQTAYDRFSLERAAAAARGYEDNALFEPKRLGLVPKVGLVYRTHGLSVEPYVKVENLVGTSSSLANEYVGELVGAVRVGYWVHKQFEVALKGWVNVGFAGGDEDKKTSLALEPQLVLRFGPVRPYAGVIIPVAGPPSDEAFVGVRLGVAGAF
jgi:hypothetical protein